MGKYDLYRAGHFLRAPMLMFFVRKLCLPFVSAAWLACEARNMKARSSWQVATEDNVYRTGDIVLIASRPYTLSTWGHFFQTFAYQLCMKTVFDHVGVIVVKQGVPYIMCTEYEDVLFIPLQEYLDSRRPRGVALRHLAWVKDPVAPTAEVAEVFLSEVRKITPEPWYGISAARRSVLESRYYTLAMEKGRALTVLERKVREHDVSPAGYAKHKERDKNIEIILKGYTEEVDFPHFPEFKLFNASLVSSFLATFDILDRDYPPPTRYVVADFCDQLPLRHGTLYEDPVIIFKS